MIGIGPFIPHPNTPFAGSPAEQWNKRYSFLSIFRLMHPSALIPATTALLPSLPTDANGNTGRSQCGDAQSVPTGRREKYDLYNNKASLGANLRKDLRHWTNSCLPSVTELLPTEADSKINYKLLNHV